MRLAARFLARGTVRREQGMVTAEAALALPALVLVAGLMLWAVLAVTAQLRCVDAARATARAFARGDSLGQSVAAGQRLAPAGARIHIGRDGDLVRVDVQAPVGALGSSRAVPTLTVSATAVVAAEPGCRALSVC
jgi:hypothetical protein